MKLAVLALLGLVAVNGRTPRTTVLTDEDPGANGHGQQPDVSDNNDEENNDEENTDDEDTDTGSETVNNEETDDTSVPTTQVDTTVTVEEEVADVVEEQAEAENAAEEDEAIIAAGEEGGDEAPTDEEVSQAEEDLDTQIDTLDTTQEELDEVNPGLTQGDLDTLEEELVAGASVFLAPEANENSTLLQWEANADMFQGELDLWGALKEADQAVVDDEATSEEDVATYTDRVAADDLAIAAITDFQTYIQTGIVDAWTTFNDEQAAAAAAAEEDTPAEDAEATTDDEDDTVSQRNVVAQGTILADDTAADSGSEDPATFAFPLEAYNVALAQYNVDTIAATEAQLATLVVVDPDNADVYEAETAELEQDKEDAKTQLQAATDAENAANGGGGSTVIVIVAVLAVAVGGGLIYWFKCKGKEDEAEGGNREPLYI